MYSLDFVYVHALHPPQQFFSIGKTLPGVNQYLTEDKESCSRTQLSSSGETQHMDHSIKSNTLATALVSLDYLVSRFIFFVKLKAVNICLVCLNFFFYFRIFFFFQNIFFK